MREENCPPKRWMRGDRLRFSRVARACRRPGLDTAMKIAATSVAAQMPGHHTSEKSPTTSNVSSKHRQHVEEAFDEESGQTVEVADRVRPEVEGPDRFAHLPRRRRERKAGHVIRQMPEERKDVPEARQVPLPAVEAQQVVQRGKAEYRYPYTQIDARNGTQYIPGTGEEGRTNI